MCNTDQGNSFYINPPGYDTETACVWGTSENPYGNWSPYVAGANTDGEGNTYVKLGWNPIYLEPATPFRNEVPEFGVEIECEGSGCNGLPCKIDPSVNGVNEMTGDSTTGAGGASFCVVTVPKGGKANVVVFDKDGSGSTSVPVSSSSVSSVVVSSSASTSSTSTSSIVPTTSSTSTVVSTTSTSTSTSTPTPTPSSTTTTSSTTLSSSSTISTSSSSSITPRPTPSWTPSSSWKISSTSAALNQTVSSVYSYKPHAMVETGSSHDQPVAAAAVASGASSQSTGTAQATQSAAVAEGAAVTSAVSKLSLIVAVLGAIVMV